MKIVKKNEKAHENLKLSKCAKILPKPEPNKNK